VRQQMALPAESRHRLVTVKDLEGRPAQHTHSH